MSNYLSVAILCLGAAAMAGASGQQLPVSKKVQFTGAGGLRLFGTLVMPASKKPVPAFLLLPGNGPTDRDGNSKALPNLKMDVLKQIAASLADAGVASLRFDKRAIEIYKSSWPSDPEGLNRFFSYRNFIDDATAALRTLDAQPGVDPSRVGILGHSEGGLFALQIAHDLAGTPGAPSRLALISAAGRPMGSVIHDQLSLRLSAPGVPAYLATRLLSYSDEACAALAVGKPLPPNEPAQLQALYNATVIDIVTAYVRTDPVELGVKFKGPVLIVNGEDDTQVSPDRDAQRLYKGLKGRPDSVTILQLVKKASHCLKSTADGNRDQFEGPIVLEAMTAIVRFCSGG